MTDSILNHLSTTLTLTDDEKAKIKPIVEQQVAEIQKQMEAQRQALQKQIEDGKAKIKPLLTPDQQKQLDAMPIPGQKPAASDETNQPASKPGQ
jgi:Spy/CpxP family protein refolding chaperone